MNPHPRRREFIFRPERILMAPDRTGPLCERRYASTGATGSPEFRAKPLRMAAADITKLREELRYP